MYCGIPYCPVSPAYSITSTDFQKLKHVISTLEPGLIFASDGELYAQAIEAVVPIETPVILTSGQLLDRQHVLFKQMLDQKNTLLAEKAFEAVQPSTIAKFLFTSGSTKQPKAVITTQRMLCSNQQMLCQTFPEFSLQPPVLVDWLPWNHTFGGSHNVGIVLIFPMVSNLRSLAGLEAEASAADVLNAWAVRQWLLELMEKLNESATGVATRIDWGALLEQAAQLNLGEITDKGSINQRAVLTHRRSVFLQF